MAEEVKEQEQQICPRCNFRLGQEDPKPEEGLLKEYFRTILGERPFEHTFPLCEGELTLRFAVLINTDSDEMSQVLRSIPKDDQPSLFADAMKVKILYHLRQINEKTYEVPKLKKSENIFSEAMVEWKKRFGDRSESLMAMCIRTLITFQQLVDLLSNAAFDQNFWQGAGLV